MAKLSAPAADPPAHPFRKHVIAAIHHGDASDARSLQTAMGPSSLGTPCLRELAHSVAEDPQINTSSDPWFAVIGKAVHLWLENALNSYQFDVLGYPRDKPRWLTENRVSITHEAYSLSGNTDVYDTERQEVIDYKIVGSDALKRYQQWGPSTTYRVQAHTYGKGWKQKGYPVRSVCIAFLPRSNFLRNTRLWSEPFDEGIADQALQRAGLIRTMLEMGIEPQMLPATATKDLHCVWCPWLNKKEPNTRKSCPGIGKMPNAVTR